MPALHSVAADSHAKWHQRWANSGYRWLKNLSWYRSLCSHRGIHQWYHYLQSACQWYQGLHWYPGSEERRRRVREPKVAVMMVLVWVLATVMIALGIVVKSKHLYPTATPSHDATEEFFKLLEKDGISLLVVGVLLHLVLLTLLLETMSQHSPQAESASKSPSEHPSQPTTEKSTDPHNFYYKELRDADSVHTTNSKSLVRSLKQKTGSVILATKRTGNLLDSDHLNEVLLEDTHHDLDDHQQHQHQQQQQHQKPALQIKRVLMLSIIWILASFATALGICTMEAATFDRFNCHADQLPALCLQPSTGKFLLAFGLTAHGILACLYINYAALHSSCSVSKKSKPLIAAAEFDTEKNHSSTLKDQVPDQDSSSTKPVESSRSLDEEPAHQRGQDVDQPLLL